MATAEETTETLVAAADDGPPLSSEPVVSQAAKMGDDGDGVSESCKKGLKGDMGSGDGGVIEVERGAIETEVSVEAVMGCGEDGGKGMGLDSVLDVEKGEEKIGPETDLNVSYGDGSDGKVEHDGNGIFLVVEAIDSLESGKESQKKNEGVDRGSFDENREGLSGKLSEINSSLSRVGDNHAIEGEGEVNATEEDDEDGDDDDDIGDEDQEYQVGDFVWGKIRSFPWWPGQIYDPSDASDYAVKLKQKDRILVAYFGDGSFSWCNPSQLKPFVDNFEEMSTRSNSKSFVNAVQKGLDEISRLVELEMTCSCLPEKDQLKDSRPINGGIKAGVLVPAGGIGKFLIAQHEPKEIIARLRNVAQEVSINNLLELTVLKSWLTAYYRAKGGYRLPLYHYPKGIEGLEDKSRDGMMNVADLSNPVEVPVQGPSEEEWFSSPVAVGPGFNESNQSLLQKCPAISGDILYQRRKQKSVAELMDDEPSEKKGSVVNGKNSGKLTSGKRKKDNNEAEKQNKSLMASQSGMKRGRKKAEASGSPRTKEKKTSSVETSNLGGEESDEIPLSRELKKRKLSSVENGEDGAEEETRKSLASRERKKSRYLSPPYTNPILQMKISSSKRGSETESEESNKLARFRERMTKVAGQLIGSQIHSKELASGHEASRSLRTRTAKQDDRMVIDSEDVPAISNQLLSQVRSAAIDPLCSREKRFLDFITENMVAFRNSFFVNPSNYEVQQDCQIGSRKRKSSSISSGPPQEVLNGSEHELPEPTRSQQKANGTNDQDFEMPLLKKAASVPEIKANDEDSIRKAAPVALILTFPPAFSLPSKDELMQIFSKFGALNEMETDVFYNSYCARVSYLKSSDAEEAFRASVERNPFGVANVNYRLRYPSAAAKVHESNQNPSSENAIASQPSVDGASHIGYLREKFKMMTSVLDTCDGRISVEMKSNLEDELKDILEKVSSIECTSS